MQLRLRWIESAIPRVRNRMGPVTRPLPNLQICEDALVDTPEKQTSRADEQLPSQQLSKEQHSDQMVKVVDMQHYDLSQGEPSYQPFHLFVGE
jgi:hypothetical protein